MRKEVWKEEGAKKERRRGRMKEKLKKEGGRKERRNSQKRWDQFDNGGVIEA